MQISGQRKLKKASNAPGAPLAPTATEPLNYGDLVPVKSYGLPIYKSTVALPPLGPIPRPPAVEPFTVECLQDALLAGPTAEKPLPYAPAKINSTGQGCIQFMEPELSAMATIPFKSLHSEEGVASFNHVLNTLGFAVIDGVLSKEDLIQAELLFAADLRGIIDVTASTDAAKVQYILEDPLHRWPIDQLSLGSKSASDWGLPQGRCAWFCRLNPNVKHVFASIFGTSELCCGTDCLFFSPNAVPPGTNRDTPSRLWPHADQNVFVKPSGSWHEVQGVLYIWPTNEDTSSTVVWPRSNQTVFETLMQRGNFRRHFCMLPKDEMADFARNARRVEVPAGGLLLWNSRTIHQGWPFGARLAVPICYEPTKRREHTALKSKERCVVEGIPTTHWASLGEAHVLGGSARSDGVSGVTIKHSAHEWCVDPAGKIAPAIAAAL